MPNFSDLIDEKVNAPQQLIPKIQALIGEIEEAFTHRPLICYAADMMKTHPFSPNSIYSLDKTMFADLLASVGDSPSVDVLIQSPGGYPDATEQLVNMLRGRFDDVSFFVPHMAKSAATMMVCSGNRIYMDHRSELGPIDPQIPMPKTGGVSISVPAQAYLDGFAKIVEMVDQAGTLSAAYLPVLNQIDVATLQMCENAIELSQLLVRTWLEKHMFGNRPGAEADAARIAECLSDHHKFLSHGRPLGLDEVKELGLVVEDLSVQPDLQTKIWELYCRIELLFDGTPWVKVFASKSFLVGKLVPHVVEVPALPGVTPQSVPERKPVPQPSRRKGRR